MGREDDLRRIAEALEAAAAVVKRFTPGEVEHRVKDGGDPVTEADLAIDDALHRILPAPGDGWLSEETADDGERLTHARLWVVDPLDGTKEFVSGIPEWCISVGLVEDGSPVAGGICAPSRGLTVLGSKETGVTLNGRPCRVRHHEDLAGIEILASRSEVKRGEWRKFEESPFSVRAMGSVALKLGLVAAGLADATWTLVPKHEWDVAAGSALVLAAGGEVWQPDGSPPRFNRPRPKFEGLLASAAGLRGPIERFLRERG